MTILVDTNVILDILLKREPYVSASRIIMTIPNIFYILRKSYSLEERRRFIRNLCGIFHISDLSTEKILSAVENEGFSDFEDALQEECAVEAAADYIVTRNPRDYERSRIKVIGPDEFVKMLEDDH